MLNVFLRNSPYVAMANYIFPVNGHGLLKTVGEDDAYKSCSYYVFDLYRRFMKGNTISLKVEGPGLESVRLGDMRVEGDNETLVDNMRPNLCYLDCAATIDEDENICISFVNRSYTQSQTVSLVIPEGYDVLEKWSVESDDVTAANSPDNRNNVIAKQGKEPSAGFSIQPCGLTIVRCAKKGAK
jgi:alpha-N-arabinofuranosidase